jgi:hypothetical protein
MPAKIDRIQVEELAVDRHVRMQSPLGRIDIHASANALGVWMSPEGSKSPQGQVGMFVLNGVANIAVWPKHPSKFPFAISANGLQVVKSDGTVRLMPLERLAELVDRLMSEPAESEKP